MAEIKEIQETPKLTKIPGVIDRLSDDNDLNEESLGSGLAAMIKLCEAILCCIRDKTLDCLKKTICKR